MYSEIGSEFWSVPRSDYTNDIFPVDTQWFLSGRSALKAIINNNKFNKAALPSWCCDSMIRPFLDADIEVCFYSIAGNFQSILPTDADVLLIMDYFGYSGYSKVPIDYKGIVIRDLTHSIFSKQYDDADYYFGSLRKWCGMWTGGFAWGKTKRILVDCFTDNIEFVEKRKQAMQEKQFYIEGVSMSKKYLSKFSSAEEDLDSLASICKADVRDIELARFLDVDFMKSRRRKNAKILMDTFGNHCIFDTLKETDCPMFVPIRVKNRNELRKILNNNGIYCPIHWPLTDFHNIGVIDKEIYFDEISLICDQRYNENDMKRMIEVIRKDIVEC